MKLFRALVGGLLAAQLLLLPSAFAAGAAPCDDAAATTTTRLTSVRAALDQAATALGGATVATHGGFVEKGLEDLAQALAATDAALDLARNNPDPGASPAPASPATDAALIRINAMRQPAPAVQPSMYRTLTGLKAALVALPTVHGGDLGGAQEKIIASLTQAVDDVIAGIEFASRGTARPARAAAAAANTTITPKNKLTGSGPIRFVEGPADGAARVLARVMQHPEDLVGVPRGSTKLVVRPPLAYYRMRNTDTLESVALAGYYYFLENAGQVVAMARINNIGGGGIGPSGGANSGEVGMAGTVDSLATRDEVRGGQYEARLLVIPRPQNRQGSVFYVLWLKSAPGGNDLIYQLPPSGNSQSLPYTLHVGILYSADEFMKMIRP